MDVRIEFTDCPACGKKYRVHDEEINVGGKGKLWSDGFRSDEPWNRLPLITRCRECYKYFWIRPGTGKNHDLPGERSSLPQIRKLVPGELAETIALKTFRDEPEERYLRTQLWWALNEPIRNEQSSDIDPEFTVLFEENLETLIYKTISNGSESRLMLAEMHRELGLFPEAGRFLDQVRDLTLRSFQEKMRERIEVRDRKVFLVE